MKIEVKKIDSTKREINVEVTGEVIKDKFEIAFKKISETTKVPGFRPGHIPMDILEKNFSQHAQELVLKELIPDVYQQVVQQEALDVIDLPDITDVKLDRSSLKFKATVEVSPEIQLKDYKGLKVKYKKIEVSPDDIKRSIDSLKESRKIDNLDDRFARSIGYPNLAELEKAMERQLFIQKENQQRRKIEEEIIETITKDMGLKAPNSMVQRQLQDLLRQEKVDLALKGLPREKIDEQEKELTENLRPVAKRQVEVYLVLAEIAKKENIPLDDHMSQHVIEFLLREADWAESS